MLLTETLNAGIKPPSTKSSTVGITDDCINCGVCVDESPSEMIIESNDEYIYNIQSEAIVWVYDGGKTSSLIEEWEILRDACPVSAIVEIG